MLMTSTFPFAVAIVAVTYDFTIRRRCGSPVSVDKHRIIPGGNSRFLRVFNINPSLIESISVCLRKKKKLLKPMQRETVNL